MSIAAADVTRAIESNRDRWQELGADAGGISAVLVELGFDAEQIDRLNGVLLDQGKEWTQHLPVNGVTVAGVAALIASAQMHALAAGIRLGRFTSGDVPQ